MALDSADYTATQRQLQERLERAHRRDLERQRQGGIRTQRQLQERQRANEQYLQQKSVQDSPEVRGDQEARAKRELYQQKFRRAQLATAPAPSGAAGEAKATGRPQTGQGEGAAAPTEQMGGIRGALARQRQKSRLATEAASKTQAGLESGQIGVEAANEAIKKAFQTIWTVVHEFLEDAALSFIDIMIITGPLCLLFFFVRVIGMFSIGRLLTITFKGVQVPLVPMFSAPEILPRLGKTLFIAAITTIIWFIIILLIWIVGDPVGAAKEIGSAIVDAILGK